MLEGLLHHKKEPAEYIAALIISGDSIDAAIWQHRKDGKVDVSKSVRVNYSGDWQQAINAADQAITQVEEALPQGTELTKVVFGLFPHWLHADHIKDEHLKELKQLTTALSLTPLGFVELPTAVVHHLSLDEGAQQTVILIGIETKQITISLYKIGKLVASYVGERSASVSADIEKILTNFSDIEVLPSRLLLYGTVANLEAIKAELLSYPWQKKANFLHFPKIEYLDNDYPIKAVAIASSVELTPQTEIEKEVDTTPAETATDTAMSAETLTEPLTQPQPDEVDVVAKDLGFLEDRDVALENNEELQANDVEETPTDEVHMAADMAPLENVVPASLPINPAAKKPFKLSLPKVPISFQLRAPKVGIIAAIVFALLVVSVTAAASYWFLPKATITVLVQPQLFDKTEEVTIDTSAASVDIEKKIIPGTVQKLTVNGSQTVSASGKKTVGEKAKGEITIFNKTLNSKTFKKGTTLTAGKLKFSLDADVSIASASEGVGSLTYGTTKAAIVAADIGTASNVGPNTDFSFEGLPATSYTARNEKALSGGTSREIAVITREDQKAVRDKTVAQLEEQARQEMMGKIGGDQKLLDDSIVSDITEEKFSKEIGEEANEVTATIAVSITAATYNQADFYTLLDKVMAGQIASGYTYKKEDSKITIETIDVEENGIWTFKPHITLQLLPDIKTADFIRRVAGKSMEEASTYFKSQSAVAGVEYDIGGPSFLGQRLPLNPTNITIALSAL